MSIVTRQEMWTGGVHSEPGITSPLMAALSPVGREALLREMREAIQNASSPEKGLAVIESWYATLQLRNQPSYYEHMNDPSPYHWYTPEEFKTAIGL